MDDAHTAREHDSQLATNAEGTPGPAMRCATAQSYVENLNAEANTRAGILVAVAKKYYLLSALSALFKYANDRVHG